MWRKVVWVLFFGEEKEKKVRQCIQNGVGPVCENSPKWNFVLPLNQGSLDITDAKDGLRRVDDVPVED